MRRPRPSTARRPGGDLLGPESLELAAERFGPAGGDQQELFGQATQRRRARLREAVSQMRVAAGADAALRVCWAELGSRVPERRAMLTPFES